MQRPTNAQALAGTFLCRNLPAQAAEQTAAQPGVVARTFEAGAVIYDVHAFAKCLGVVLSGQVDAYKNAEEPSRRVLMNTLYAGQVFGAAALFVDTPDYVTQIVARKKSRVLFVPQAALRTLFAAYPQAAENYIAFLSERIVFLNQRIDAYTAPTAQGKLAAYLAEHACVCPDGSARVDLPFGMNKLAQALGIGRASLYRAMEAMQQAGWVTRDNRTVTVLHINDFMQAHKGA